MPTLNTAEGRAWPRNLARDPRVTLSVQNMQNPYEYVESADGSQSARAREPTSTSTRLRRSTRARRSTRTGSPANERVIIRVEPEHVHYYGGLT